MITICKKTFQVHAELMQKSMNQYIKDGLFRQKTILDQRVEYHRNFASNDYLCLTMHPDVNAAFIAGAQQYGFGSGSATAIVGYFKPQHELEEQAAQFLQREKAILFNSGYHANLGVMSALANRNHAIVADKLCHASILDGIQLSRAKHKRYSHNDPMHAEALLKAEKNAILVTESIFSMQGNITPIDLYNTLAKKNDAIFIVDDAHALGILGENGRGSSEHFNLTADCIDVLISPLGKSCGGLGAIVSGNKELILGLEQFARTYRYTTALPPAIIQGLRVALKILETEIWRRERLHSIIQYFVKQAKLRKLTLISEDATPIKSILVGDNHKVLGIQEKLLTENIYIGAIRPPTVPKNTARLRISLHCEHQEKDIDHLLDIIADYEK